MKPKTRTVNRKTTSLNKFGNSIACAFWWQFSHIEHPIKKLGDSKTNIQSKCRLPKNLFKFGVFFIQSKQLRIFLLMKQNKLNKEFLQKFKKLDDEISSLQDTEIKMAQQNSYLQDLQQQVSQAKQELEAIRELEFEIKN
jgi:hypothetical protein